MKNVFKQLLIGSISLLLISSTTLANANGCTPQNGASAACGYQVKKKIIKRHPKKRVSPQGSSTGKVCISCIGS